MPPSRNPPDHAQNHRPRRHARTREALAAFDALDAKVDAEGNHEALAELFGQIDDAKLAIGEAFALDTADRNPDHKQTAQWAAPRPQEDPLMTKYEKNVRAAIDSGS